MSIARVIVDIITDASKARSGFKEASTASEKFQQGLDSASKKAALALGGIGAAAVDAGRKAAEFADASSAAGVIFGEKFGKQITDWSKTAAASMGVGQQAAIDAANNFATFGKSAGLAGTDLAKFAQDNAQLAADLASFKGTSPEQAIEALGAAFRGEAEPMRAFGVLLDDASMRNEAVRMGLIKTTKEALTPQQKVLAAQALILKQTGDAQGDFARTSGSVANQQKTMTATIDNARIAIGEKLQPAFATILPILVDAATWVGNNADIVLTLTGVIAGAAAAIIGINTAVKVYTATTKAITSAKKIWAAAQLKLNVAMTMNPIGIVVTAIVALVAIVVLAYKKSETFRNIVDAIGRVLRTYVITAFNAYKTAIAWVIEKVVTLWTKTKGLRDALSSIAKTISGTVSAAFNAVKSTIQTVIDKVAALWSKFVEVKDKIASGIDAITPWSAAPLAAGVGTYAGGGRSSRSAAAPMIVINGAIDASSVAKQIKKLLAAEDLRSGNVNSQAWSAW